MEMVTVQCVRVCSCVYACVSVRDMLRALCCALLCGAVRCGAVRHVAAYRLLPTDVLYSFAFCQEGAASLSDCPPCLQRQRCAALHTARLLIETGCLALRERG